MGFSFRPSVCVTLCLKLIYFSMATTTTFTHTRVQVGESHSLLCRRVSTNRLSIVDRLTTRLVTEHGLQILVHQHYVYLLHLEWKGGSSRVSSKFMERRFLMSGEAHSFCTELCSHGLEGLCTCVSEGYYLFTHVRAPRCLREPLMQSQKYLLKQKLWLKALQDTSNVTRSGCRISSSYMLEWRDN